MLVNRKETKCAILAMINMLRALMEKVDNMHEQVGNVHREMEALRKKQMGISETKKH